MTNDWRKGSSYRERTDSNFRLRKKRAAEMGRKKRRLFRLKKIPKSQQSGYVLHHMPHGDRLMLKAAHDRLHKKRGDYNTKGGKMKTSILRKRKR